jgi:hypothetical protein
MSNEIIITATSEVSGRTATVGTELHSVWLYLSSRGETRPEVACWILNTREAPAVPDFAVYRRASSPPPVPAERLASAAPDPGQGRWSLLWAGDGNAVAALLDETAVAFVIADHSRGYARYVKSGAEPWALPWDEGRFTTVFDGR